MTRRRRDTITEQDLFLMRELGEGRDIPNASAWVRRFARRLRRTLAPLDAEVEHRITTVVENEARTPRPRRRTRSGQGGSAA
jgi:hypothetical protein